jgi:hypothetical protein
MLARIVCSLLLAVVCSPFALASPSSQIQIGTVRVTVTDPSADVVVGAVATLANKITGYKQSTTTDERGVAGFDNVPVDDYDVVIEALRFQQATRRITVRSNLPIELEVKLAVPGSQETVTVEAEAGLIDRDSFSSEQDLQRERFKPWTLLGFSTGAELFRKERVGLSLQFDVLNFVDRRFAYNFGNPFESTHFGRPRQWSARVRLSFR